MKTRKQNERVVYYGGRNEDLYWGWVQFPALYQMSDGNIGIYVHDDDDSWMSLGDNTGKYLVTENEGESWRKATKEDVAKMGTILPSGDVIRVSVQPPVELKGVEEAPWQFGNYRTPVDPIIPQKSEDPKKLPMPITTYSDIFEQKFKVYYLDTLPDGMVEKRFSFYRLKAGETEARKEFAPVDWKYRTVVSFPPHHATREGEFDKTSVMINQAGLYGCRRPIVAPDGSLYVAHYCGNAVDPFTGVYHGCTSTYIFRSTDEGRSWKVIGYIPYQPDESKDILAHLKAGFDEPSLAFLPNGEILCLMRTCDVFYGAPEWGPTYLARSSDGGRTWSKPEYFKDRGALPQLLQLECGVTLAVITRPGIYVYASYDGGKTWDDGLEIMTDKDRSSLANEPPARANFHQWAGSCCNCTILPLGKNKAILAFSDFYTPDENGVKRKAIKTIEIVVD